MDDILNNSNFRLGVRDKSVRNHWREIDGDFSFADNKTILILPGSGTNSAKSANGMCKIAENMLEENILKKVTICSLYFPEQPQYAKIAPYDVQLLFDKYFLPMIAKVNENGDLEKISSAQAKKNLRNVIIFTHCYGSYIYEALDKEICETLKKVGYSKEECMDIQRQLFVVHHNNICENIEKQDLKSTNLIRITQADERILTDNLDISSFQYFVQQEEICPEEVLYVRVADNERVLLVRQVSKDGVDEHNGGYWSTLKKTEGGIREEKAFKFIFQEAVNSNYPLENVEQLIREVVKHNSYTKDEFQNILTDGKSFTESFIQYNTEMKSEFQRVKDKLLISNLSEKEAKSIPENIWIMCDDKGKMLIDYAVNTKKIPTIRGMWRRMCNVMDNGLDCLLSYNEKLLPEKLKKHIQEALNSSDEKLFAMMAKGYSGLARLNYEKANDNMILTAGEIYAKQPKSASQLDKLYFYKALIYIYTRCEKMESSEKVDTVVNLLEQRIFTKENNVDKFVQHKIKSYVSQFKSQKLADKCQKQWPSKKLNTMTAEKQLDI